MKKPAPHCQDALQWLKIRGWNLTTLVPSDTHSLLAIAHCWNLWTQASDSVGQRAAIDAVAALLDCCQEVAWPMARELIAHASDWGHRSEVWPKVARRFEEHVRMQFGSVVNIDDINRVKRMERCHVGLTEVHPP
jgi:hypothetical protein